MVAKCLGKGRMGSLFNGNKVSVLQDEKSFGCTTMCMYLTLLNCTIKHSQDGKFHSMCILPQLNIIKRKLQLALLMSHKVDFKANNITRNKKAILEC